MFHDNPIVISRKLALNRNSDFQTDANGTTNTTGITGFTKTSGAGIQVDNTISFSGTQSLKVNADGVNNWVDLETEIVPLQGANRVYGQVRVYLPSGSAKVNVNTVVTFYADDKTTVISTVTLAQNMDYSAVPGSGNQWYALLTGTDASPTTIPPRATYAKFHVTFGSIAVPFWVDDMILSKM